jgi:hypothetical protein
MSNILLNLTIMIDQSNYDPKVGVWRFDALLLPGGEITHFTTSAGVANPGWYKRDQNEIRWSGPEQPLSMSLRVPLPKQYIEAKRLSLEQEKHNLEQDKHRVETRWRKYAFIASLVTMLIGSVTTYLVATVSRSEKPAPAANAPQSEQIMACRDGLARLEQVVALPDATIDKARTAVTALDSICKWLEE